MFQPTKIDHVRVCIVLACVALLGLANSKSEAAPGFVTYQIDKKNDPKAMSGNDFRKILDKSLGDKFKDLIVIFGGCFSKDLTNAMKDGKAAKSKQNFAFLSSTGVEGSCFAEGDVSGNYFLQGVAQGFFPYTGPSTVGQAFDSGQTKVKEGDPTMKTETDARKDQKPMLFPDTDQAKKITLGKGATSYHAILFAGEPKVCADWVDVLTMFDSLVASGYKPEDIKVLFGSGKRDPNDSSPVLENGKSALDHKKNVEKEKKCKYSGIGGIDNASETTDAAGKPLKVDIQPATYKGFQKALEDLGPISEKSATEQYVIWTGTHNGSATDLITETKPSEEKADKRRPRKEVTKKTKRRHAKKQPTDADQPGMSPETARAIGTALDIGMGIGLSRIGRHHGSGDRRDDVERKTPRSVPRD